MSMLRTAFKDAMGNSGTDITEPSNKRQKVNDFLSEDSPPQIQNVLTRAVQAETIDPKQAIATWDSSFSHANASPLTLETSKFIPVGCLRIYISDCMIEKHVWNSCNTWSAFSQPLATLQPAQRYLPAIIQELLLKSPALAPFRKLLFLGWIRMEFRSQNDRGQVRVFILPDDVGRASIDRAKLALRRTMHQLFARLDVSKATWNGDWSDETPTLHLPATIDEKRAEDDTSLFDLFNTLPSPSPDLDAVADPYVKYAMASILDSDIEGLQTVMYSYQRRSAALMLQREFYPGQTIDPRLTPLKDQKGERWYCEFAAGSLLVAPRTYEAPRGGICAETMGLGKTLICLALILATRNMPSKIPVEYSVGTIPVRKSTSSLKEMAAAAVTRHSLPWKSYLSDGQGGYINEPCAHAIMENTGYYLLPSPEPRRKSRNPRVAPPRKIWLTAATLVIVPSNLVKQWTQEIKKHTIGLKYLVMDSTNKALPSPEELISYDIILFSKARFEQEARDGSDDRGRRQTTTSTVCNCPYIGDTRTRDCNCFQEHDVYHSPLKSLHFKRLITDEGHTFGNTSRSSKTLAVMVIDFLQLDARWIVSGTPTQGLYGREVAAQTSNNPSAVDTPISPSTGNALNLRARLENVSSIKDDDMCSISSQEREKLFHMQERKDLEKLGNIASGYLKARPWAGSHDDPNTASWMQHVMQPRHGSKSQGNMECLRATLESMVIRHRPEDVECEVKLPPLYQDIVHLEGSLQDKLSLNTFSLMIVSNAVTSERKDADYLFHPRQRAALQELVSNLRQASFFWSGYTPQDIKVTTDIAKQFLEKGEILVSAQDESLLKQAIELGELVLKNPIKDAISKYHEMPMYVENEAPSDVRLAWALDEGPRNPTLIGTSMIHESQKFVNSQLWKEDPIEGMVEAGQKAMSAAIDAQYTTSPARVSKASCKESKKTSKASESIPALACGVAVGNKSSLKRRSSVKSLRPVSTDNIPEIGAPANGQPSVASKPKIHESGAEGLSSAMKPGGPENFQGLDETCLLTSAAIVSTASAKLSYLLDRIVFYHEHEKILVFYEADNVAYYIAQALECLGIKHLIYAKTLHSKRRADYVVTFNHTETFRVLLMDVSQAAFGLDMSSASRVYFINPVFSPQIEAQAVKRAHRIGQYKPVYVETLVLRGSIEELILERRKAMSNEEHNKVKNILDDQAIYDWIRNVRFISVPTDNVPGPEQMAKLEAPQLIYGRRSSAILHPDADILMGDISPMFDHNNKGKGKGPPNFDAVSPIHIRADQSGIMDLSSTLNKGHIPNLAEPSLPLKRKTVSFLEPSGAEPLIGMPAQSTRFESPPTVA